MQLTSALNFVVYFIQCSNCLDESFGSLTLLTQYPSPFTHIQLDTFVTSTLALLSSHFERGFYCKHTG